MIENDDIKGELRQLEKEDKITDLEFIDEDRTRFFWLDKELQTHIYEGDVKSSKLQQYITGKIGNKLKYR